jgi:hypothetical protein
MANRYPNKSGRSIEKAVSGNGTHQSSPDLFQEDRQAGKACEKLNIKQSPRAKQVTNEADRADWNSATVCFLIVFALIVSIAVAGYLLWAKISALRSL